MSGWGERIWARAWDWRADSGRAQLTLGVHLTFWCAPPWTARQLGRDRAGRRHVPAQDGQANAEPRAGACAGAGGSAPPRGAVRQERLARGGEDGGVSQEGGGRRGRAAHIEALRVGQAARPRALCARRL
eukprot:5544122-Prymnesium_polylepis.2